jgi:hypothetical protein
MLFIKLLDVFQGSGAKDYDFMTPHWSDVCDDLVRKEKVRMPDYKIAFTFYMLVGGTFGIQHTGPL